MSQRDTPSSQVFLGRQPILDREQKLHAYELLFRGSQSNHASILDGVQATATVISNVFGELSIGDVLGTYRGFINVDRQLLFSDTLELLPKESVVIELLETIELTPQVVARCNRLREAGFVLALDDVVELGPAYADVLTHVDIVKVDIKAIAPAQLAAVAAQIRDLGKTGLAEKVDSRAEMEHCQALGFALFQGYFFARPVVIQGKKLDHSQLTLLKLMNLLQSDADSGVIENTLKQEPGLTLNLLRLANSVASGLSGRAASLRQAIALLGRRQLQRWLQLLLYANAQPGANPLLQLAATRGRTMELLAEKISPADRGFADNAFMTGILSLTPALLGLPIGAIVGGLNFAADVRDGLLQRAGRQGQLLGLVESLEDRRFDTLQAILDGLPALAVGDVNQALAQAIAWANAIEREAS
jgi:c-di-GMP-related signal transduction protein